MESFDLPGGYKIVVSGNTIELRGVRINIGREPTKDDISFVKTVFSCGMAASQGIIAQAFNLLVDTVNQPIKFPEKKEEKSRIIT